MEPKSPEIIDRSYALHEPLGQGGMGTVFRATQLVSGLAVALKLVAQRQDDEPKSATNLFDHRLALTREFRTLASLQHENVIRVLSYGFDDVFGPYYTMELLEQPRNILDAARGKSDAEKVELIAQLLRALVYLHARGVLHRDIKPGNVLCCRGEVKLLDFGIAVNVKAKAELAGTVEYMAPELLLGRPPSIASDLYSVGVLAYQLFANQYPYNQESMTRMLRGILGTRSDLTLADSVVDLLAHYATGSRQPVRPRDEAGGESRPAFDSPLSPVIEKMLLRDPQSRYASAKSVLEALSLAANLPLPAETASTRESFLQATALVGRDKELAELRQGLTAAQKRQGCAVLVAGESGVGKSRLISELRTLALVHELWVAEGQSTTEGGSPYHEWRPLVRALGFRATPSDAQAAILRELVPDLEKLLGRALPAAEAVAPEEKQARLGRTLAEVLASLEKPLLLLFEDLQWARSESLELLALLLPRLHDLPVFVVGTYRIDEQPQLHERLQPARFIRLLRLDREDIAKLSQDMLGALGEREDIVAYLERQTEGNAFFLVEVLRALAESSGALARIGEGELPETLLTAGIERILERRLEQTGPEHHGVLEFLAVAGREIDLRLLEKAFPSFAQSGFLRACANAAVLEAQGTLWRFAHDKLRETLRRRISDDARPAIHDRVAEAMEAVYDKEERRAQSAVLAYHYEQAERLESALPYAAAAGDMTMQHGLYKEARGHYATALLLLARLPERPELIRWRIDLLLKQVQAGLLSDTKEVQQERVTAAQKCLDALQKGAGLIDADRLRAARIDYYQGRLLYYSGQAREAIECYKRVLPVAKEFGDRELLVLPSYVIGMALMMQGQMGKGVGMMAQVIEPIRFIAPVFDWIRALLAHAMMRAGTGDYRGARESIPAIHKNVAATGIPVARTLAHIIDGVILRLGFDWPASYEQCSIAVELARQAGDKMYTYLTCGLRSHPASALGFHQEARADRELSIRIAQELGGRLFYMDWFDAFDADIALAAGRPEEAIARARSVVATSSVAGLIMSHGTAERVWGNALRKLAQQDANLYKDACEHFEKSVSAFSAGGLVLEVAQSRLNWGATLLQVGDVAAASAQIRPAVAQFQQSGCEYAVRNSEQLLAKLDE